jgi:hypothetical protein
VNPTELAVQLDAGVDTLTTVAHMMSGLSVPARAFGADEVGVPGRVGRELHARWDAVLAARSREASDAAARLAALAVSLRTTQQQYTDTDEAVARRMEREVS